MFYTLADTGRRRNQGKPGTGVHLFHSSERLTCCLTASASWRTGPIRLTLFDLPYRIASDPAAAADLSGAIAAAIDVDAQGPLVVGRAIV